MIITIKLVKICNYVSLFNLTLIGFLYTVNSFWFLLIIKWLCFSICKVTTEWLNLFLGGLHFKFWSVFLLFVRCWWFKMHNLKFARSPWHQQNFQDKLHNITILAGDKLYDITLVLDGSLHHIIHIFNIYTL